VPLVLVDVHAETTSEKQALGWYLDGRASAIVGTHTHVATADERILPGGSAYITDVGMTGPHDGVIGMERAGIVKRFIDQLPSRFGVAEGEIQMNAVIIEADLQAKTVPQMQAAGGAAAPASVPRACAVRIERVRYLLDT